MADVRRGALNGTRGASKVSQTHCTHAACTARARTSVQCGLKALAEPSPDSQAAPVKVLRLEPPTVDLLAEERPETATRTGAKGSITSAF